MLRRLRYQLFERVLRFPLPQFRKLSQGEIVAMITSETEDIGGYIGDSVALPAFQGGTLITILVFMFVQDWILGLAAIALYPLQGWLIPKFQRKVNLLKKERVLKVRKLSERIGEVVTGVREVHTHDTSQFELADYSQRIGEVFYIRLQIYKQKFFIKFLNNFIAQITPFFFYSIGGYLVIKGDLSFGALVAVLAAYKDLSAPWKELLNYYQVKEDARIKYELLLETFEPPGLLDERIIGEDVEQVPALTGKMVAGNLDLSDIDGARAFAAGVTFTVTLPAHIAVVGAEGSGKHRLTDVVAALVRPESGSLAVAGLNLLDAPESVTGRCLAYVGTQAVLQSGTLRDNLYYGLRHRPGREAVYGTEDSERRAQERRETALSGNSPYDVNADWVDYAALGVDGPQELTARALEVLRVVDMENDVYELGLQGRVDPDARPELAARILSARNELRSRLDSPDFAPLVEPFDQERYNTNMSVAENMLFGAPRDPEFEMERLPYNEAVMGVLRDFGLEHNFVEIGRQVAALMVDLFADVEPGSPLFEQFSFIGADDLPVFRSLLSRAEGKDASQLAVEDRRMLLSLPLKLVVARHRLGLIDDSFQKRLVEARQVLLRRFGSGDRKLEPFDRGQVNSAVSIQDNILFGRLAYGRARGAGQVGALVRDVLEKLELRAALMEVGLDFNVGIAGSRLSGAQRQKVALARAVLKRPEVLVLDEATASLDEGAQATILENLFHEFRGRSLFWLLHRPALAELFDHVLVLEDGKLAEQGVFADINLPGSVLSRMTGTPAS
jgi:ABC-type multidrug transport system fused ATPase/permease subunit